MTTAAQRTTTTQLEEDFAFHRREWRAQRFGLIGLSGLVAASALGAFGQNTVILRTVAIYGFLLLVFRLAGKRTVAQLTSFDFIVLLIIGDATQQALIGDDYTLTTAAIAVSCLILVDVALGWLKSRWPSMDRVVDGVPLIIVFKGRILKDRMDREGLDIEDILEAAREQEGLESIDQVDFAVLERHGGVSIIPKRGQ
jgi:uncharacterized membrane protein YcaP (DUF421 family)